MINLEKYYKIGFWIALFAVIALFYKSCDDHKTLKDKEIQESNLRKALTDSLTHFQTKEGSWGVEKRTLQTDLSNLKDANLNLNENQKSLVKEVERQNKTASTIAAALIELKAEVANIKNNKPAVETDSTIEFTSKNTPIDSVFKYDLTIFNVKRFKPMLEPTLTINKISFPNKQTINFHWKNDKKEGYPIAFTVINTNPYFKVSDIESYSIPELTRAKVKPTFWQKVGTFSKSTGGKIIFFGAGVVVGGLFLK